MSAVAESAIVAQLKATSGVTSIVGQRVFPRIAPQRDGTTTSYGTRPFIVVLRPPGQMRGHTNNKQIAVARTPVIVACVGNDYDESRSISGPVVAALDPSGWTGSQTWNGTEVASCWQTDEFDQSALPQLADEFGVDVEYVSFELEHST